MRTAFSRISGMTAQQRAALAEEFNKISRIAVAEPVAVVGIGCRFPGDVAGPDSFWDLLVEGRNAISRIPADRWDADAFYHPDPLTPGRMTTKWGGFVPDIAGFDAEFFGITPREAAAMDPQQRMLLEVAWEALENAGIPPDSLSGSRTGVMMGVYFNEYQSMLAASPENVDAYSGTGNAHSITVGRISYLLGLRGPAVAVDTACSSSLVAVHLACQSLRLRETDLALAGGVSITLRPETQIAISAWGLLSPQGRCATFDAAADGFVRGEGAGVVVLKRLTDAVRDGDRVLAVVRGSAVNQDGRSNGVTAPNTAAQCDVIADALRSGDVAPESVNYVEAHGTGTVLGDPIEFEALAATYGRGDGACALGAVKTNLGHLEAAAGIAGFIKAALAVQRGHIPPNLHFSQWNPAINASATRFFVPTENSRWPTDEGPRRAAVSSFGLGGTNAHVIIEQGPELACSIRTRLRHRGVDVGGDGQDAAAGGRDGCGAGRLDGGPRRRGGPGRCGPHRQPPPRPASQIRHRGRPRTRPGGGRVARTGRRPARPRRGGLSGRLARAGHGVRLLRARFTVGRDGPPIVGRRTGFRCRSGRTGAGVRRTGRVLFAGRDRRRQRTGRHRTDPAGPDRNAVGADRIVALLRGATRPGDRPLDGRGGRRRRCRSAHPRRGIAGDRHPLAADGPTVRTGRHGTARTRRRGHRGVDRRLPAGDVGHLQLAAPNRDRRTHSSRSTHSSTRYARRTVLPAASISKWPRTIRRWMRCSPRCVRSWPI